MALPVVFATGVVPFQIVSDDNYVQDICRTNDRIHNLCTILVHFAIFKAADVINNKTTCLMIQQIQLLFPEKHIIAQSTYTVLTQNIQHP